MNNDIHIMQADLEAISGLFRHDLVKDHTAECNTLEHIIELLKQQQAALSARDCKTHIIRNFLKEPPQGGSEALRYFFAERGLMLKSYTRINELSPEENTYLNLAKKLPQQNSDFWSFIDAYCKTSPGKSFNFQCNSGENYTSVFNFCQELQHEGKHEITQSNNPNLTIAVPKKGHCKPFLNGAWGEYFILYRIQQVLHRLAQGNNDTPPIVTSFEPFFNLRLSLPKSVQSVDMELDVAVIVNKRHLYIFESKCGENLRIDAWVDRTRIFETLEPEALPRPPKDNVSRLKGHFITCTRLSDINPAYFKPYHLFHFDTFNQNLKKLVINDLLKDIEEKQTWDKGQTPRKQPHQRAQSLHPR